MAGEAEAEPTNPAPETRPERKICTPFPKVPHLELQRENVGSHILIIGDVHGCASEFRTLVDQVVESLGHRPTIISVGDLVNKGPSSKEAITFARENNILTVRGNHDDDLLEAHYKVGRFKDGLSDYHHTTLQEVSLEDILWVQNCPFTISCPWLQLIVVHAGLVPGVKLEDQRAEDMFFMRDVVTDPETGKFKTLEEGTDDSRPWAEVWGGPELIVFGHDARRKLQNEKYAIGLDTGCCYGLKLTGVVINADDVTDRHIVSVDAEQMYCDPTAKSVEETESKTTAADEEEGDVSKTADEDDDAGVESKTGSEVEEDDGAKLASTKTALVVDETDSTGDGALKKNTVAENNSFCFCM